MTFVINGKYWMNLRSISQAWKDLHVLYFVMKLRKVVLK